MKSVNSYRWRSNGKNRFLGFNLLIAIVCLFGITLSLMLTFAYQQPAGLEQQTGKILSFNQRDEKWYDAFFDSSAGSYFHIWLEDGSYYEATGICYDNINRELFDDVQVGGSIAVTYFEKSGGLRKIYALEYNGKTYLLLDDVLNEYSQSEKTAHIVGPTMLVLSVLAGIILFVVNYRKNWGT